MGKRLTFEEFIPGLFKYWNNCIDCVEKCGRMEDSEKLLGKKKKKVE